MVTSHPNHLTSLVKINKSASDVIRVAVGDEC